MFCLVLTIPKPFSGRLLIGQVVSLSSVLYLSDWEHRRELHSNKGARTVSSCPGPQPNPKKIPFFMFQHFLWNSHLLHTGQRLLRQWLDFENNHCFFVLRIYSFIHYSGAFILLWKSWINVSSPQICSGYINTFEGGENYVAARKCRLLLFKLCVPKYFEFV